LGSLITGAVHRPGGPTTETFHRPTHETAGTLHRPTNQGATALHGPGSMLKTTLHRPGIPAPQALHTASGPAAGVPRRLTSPSSHHVQGGWRNIARRLFTGTVLTTAVLTTTSEAVFPANPVSAAVRQVVSSNFPPELLQPVNQYIEAVSLPTLAVTPRETSDIQDEPLQPDGGQQNPQLKMRKEESVDERVKPIPTLLPSATASIMPTQATSTPTPADTPTITLSSTPLPSPTPTISATPSATPSITPTPTRTHTPLPSPTDTPNPTDTPFPTATPFQPTNTPLPIVTPPPTSTPLPTLTPSPIPTLAPTSTSTPLPSPTNSPPIAANDSATTPMNTDVTVLVLFNDSDSDGGTLTITGITQGANGSVTFTASDVTYTPNTGYTGSDSFSYTASDGNGGTATGTVTITVLP
jgi:hypothetical protein